MASVKISSKVEESAWRELRALADESHQNISGLLTEAIQDYVRRRRLRPEVIQHLEDSIQANERLVDCLPSEPVKFLSLDEVVAIHARLIDHFGGPSGIRDRGLLESALYRPRSGYYEDLVSMAAAMFESLLMNHPFVDGNKRVAFFSVDVFLRMNGWRLQVDPDSAHAHLIGLLERGDCDHDALHEWLGKAVARR